MQTGQNSIAPENSLPQLGQVRWGSALILLCDGEILEDDDEHEHEDDFSTSEFRIKQNCGSIPALGYRCGPDRHVGLADGPRQRPFHHLANIRFGVPFVLFERFDADALLDAIERHRSPNLTGRLADYKVPESLQIVDEIPRNATGKVDRQSLSKVRTDCSNFSLKKYRRINRHRRPILVPYKFVGLVSSPRWILRPRAEEAIRTTITAIGTANGRSPKNYSRLELRQRDKKSLAA
jgi:hypothetical protein